MTATTRTPGKDPTTAAGQESILGTTAGDRCSVCGTELAGDQHYCVECGTRRGRPRFSLAEARRASSASSTASTGSAVAGHGPTPTRGWWASSASATLVAGIAVLLIAMGVGFEIGHSGARNVSPGVPKIVVNGGGASNSAAGTTGAGSTGPSLASKHHKSTSSVATGTPKKALTSKKALAKAISKPPSAAAVKQASKKAGGVLHTKSGVKIAPSSTKVGGKCASGTAGCHGRKFTGNFFGNS